jgi:hypothetical protein
VVEDQSGYGICINNLKRKDYGRQCCVVGTQYRGSFVSFVRSQGNGSTERV